MRYPDIYVLFDKDGECIESCHGDPKVAYALAVNGFIAVPYSAKSAPIKIKAFQRTMGMYLDGDVEIEITPNTDGTQLIEWIRTSVCTRVRQGSSIRIILKF